MEDYQLPSLKPPGSYDKCVYALQKIDQKVQEALTSPSRARYTMITEATAVFLSRGNLHKIEVDLARKGQIETYKRRLDARKSLQKRGSILSRIVLAFFGVIKMRFRRLILLISDDVLCCSLSQSFPSVAQATVT
jgi:hypothetical protein